jgi:hypothetical protein
MTASETRQELKMQAEPQREHHWLQRLVGEWTFEVETRDLKDSDQPPVRTTGTESVRSLGGLWTIAEGQGEMPGGGPETSVITLGYDPRTRRFVGTWLGSMMTHLWICDGWLDAAERVLTLESEGPSMAGDGTLAKYRDVIEFQNDDHRMLTAHALGEDGEWRQFMTAHYRRKR